MTPSEVGMRPEVGSPEASFEEPVSKVMLRDPETVSVNDSLQSVLAKLNRAGVGHIPVLDDHRPVGMITARDLARSILMPPTALTRPELELLLHAPVRWVMSTPLVTLPPQLPIRVAVRLMMERGVGSVVVVDPLDGRLLGLVTRSVIVEVLARSA